MNKFFLFILTVSVAAMIVSITPIGLTVFAILVNIFTLLLAPTPFSGIEIFLSGFGTFIMIWAVIALIAFIRITIINSKEKQENSTSN